MTYVIKSSSRGSPLRILEYTSLDSFVPRSSCSLSLQEYVANVEMKIVKSECAEPVPQYRSGHKVTSDTTGIFGETSEERSKRNEAEY
jgi:hypothetical protein